MNHKRKSMNSVEALSPDFLSLGFSRKLKRNKFGTDYNRQLTTEPFIFKYLEKLNCSNDNIRSKAIYSLLNNSIAAL